MVAAFIQMLHSHVIIAVALQYRTHVVCSFLLIVIRLLTDIFIMFVYQKEIWWQNSVGPRSTKA
jgi:hypothetical protein